MHNRRLILEHRSHAMKHSATPSESALWQRLRAGKLGTRFRRQAIIAGFIVDFVAPARRVAITNSAAPPMRAGIASSLGSAIACSGFRKRSCGSSALRFPHGSFALAALNRAVP
jgi:hypothetical protein